MTGIQYIMENEQNELNLPYLKLEDLVSEAKSCNCFACGLSVYDSLELVRDKKQLISCSCAFCNVINHLRILSDDECDKEYSLTCLGVLRKFHRSGWIRDLTTEGVEPNPGPGPKRNKNKNKGKKKSKDNSNKTLVQRIKSMIPKGSFQTLGTAAGGMFGPIGATAGGLIGRGLATITGMGAYKVRSNSLMGGQVPQFVPNTPVRIKHKEFLQDISGSVSFTLQSFEINPGLVSTFPFLSLVAANFEQYRFNGLIFEFKSTSATALNSTNTALGVVIMSTNYDTSEINFASKQQMEAYEYSNSAVPSESQIHFIECDPRMNALANMYVRVGAIPANFDERFYDLGNFQIATAGMQATAVIGELWVSYDITLLKPKLPTPLGANLLFAHCVEFPAASAAAAGSAFFGTGGLLLRSGSTLGILPSPLTGNTFVLPLVGVFLVSMTWTGSVTVVPTLSVGSAITKLSILEDNSVSSVATVSTNTTNYVSVWSVATPGTGANNTATVTGLTNLAAGNCDVLVSQVSSGITGLVSRIPSVKDIMSQLEELKLTVKRHEERKTTVIIEEVFPEQKK